MYNPKFDLEVNPDKLKSCFDFKNDLQVGAAGEALVDLILNDDKIKIEVKRDDWATKSGKIAIEFESRGKPSGIQVTQAQFWAHVIGQYFVLLFPVEFLRQTYEKLSKKPEYVKVMGDKNSSGVPVAKAILIPWTELLSMFKNYASS